MTSLAPKNQAVTTLNKSIISSIVDTVKDYTNDETNQLTILESKYYFQNKAKSNIDDLKKLLTEYNGPTIQYSGLVLPKLKSFQSKINEKIDSLNEGDKQLVNDFTDMWNRLNTNTISDHDKSDGVQTLLEKNYLAKLSTIPLIKNGGGLFGHINESRNKLTNIVTDFITRVNGSKRYYDIVQLNNKTNNADRITQYAFVYYDYSDANIEAINKYYKKIIEYDDNVEKTLTSVIESIYFKINRTDMREIDEMSKKISSMLLYEIQQANNEFNTKCEAFIGEIKEMETKLHAKIYFFNDKLKTIVTKTNPQNDEQVRKDEVLNEVIGPYECVVDINFFNHTINDIILNYEVDSKIKQLNEEIEKDKALDDQFGKDLLEDKIARYEGIITESKNEILKNTKKIENIEIKKQKFQTQLTILENDKPKITIHDLMEDLSKIIEYPIEAFYDKIFTEKQNNNEYIEKIYFKKLADLFINTKKDGPLYIKSLKQNPKYIEIISKAKIVDERLDKIINLENEIRGSDVKIDNLNKSIEYAENNIPGAESKIKILDEQIKNHQVKNYAVDDSKNNNIVKNLKIVETTGGISIQKLLSHFSISPKIDLNTYTFPYDWKLMEDDLLPQTIKINQSIQIVNKTFYVSNQFNIENIFTYGDKKGQSTREYIKSKIVDIITKEHSKIDDNPWILDSAVHMHDERTAINIPLSIFSKNFNSLIGNHNELLRSIWSKNERSLVFTEMKKMVEPKILNNISKKETITSEIEKIMGNIAVEIEKEQDKIDKQKTTRGALGFIFFIVFATLFIYLIDYGVFGGTITQGLSNIIIDIIIFLLSPFKEIRNLIWHNVSVASGKATRNNAANAAFFAFNYANKAVFGAEKNIYEYYKDTTVKDVTNKVVSGLGPIHVMLLTIYAAIGGLLYINGAGIKKMISDGITKWFSNFFDLICNIPYLNKVLPCEGNSNRRKSVMELVNTKLNEIINAQNTAEMKKILKKLSEESINKGSLELSGIKLAKFENLLDNLENTNSESLMRRSTAGFFNNVPNRGGSKLSKKNKHKRINIASKRRPVKLKKMRRTKKMRGGANPEIDIIIRSFMAFINNIIELVLYGKTSTIDQTNDVIEMVLDDSNSFTSFFDILYKCFTNIRIPKEEHDRPSSSQTRKHKKD